MEKTALVLDASVLLKWYYDENDSDKAIAIRDKFNRSELDILVPQILYYEVSNVFRYNKMYELAEKNRMINNLFSLGLETRLLSSEDMIIANELANTCNVTIYDAVYLSLARQLGIPLVTADEEFVKKVRAKDAVALNDWK